MGLIPRREYAEVELPVFDEHGEPLLDSQGAPIVERTRVVRWEVFNRWRQKAQVAFVAVVLAATGAAYLGWAAGRSSDKGLAANARVAVRSSCDDRADGRITTALGFDQLRFAAITPPKTAAQRRAIESFLHATQGPINDLLTQAAYGSEKTGKTPIHTVGALREPHSNGTTTNDPELTRARTLATRRCVLAAAKFNGRSFVG